MLEGGLEGEYTIIVHCREGGGYYTEVPELPDCIAEGETVNEVVRMTEDAVMASLAEGEESSPEGGNIEFKLLLRIDRFA